MNTVNTGGYRIPLEPPRPRGHPGGLIMFGPIAAAYPQHARAMLSLDMTNFALLVLFGVLSLSFTLGVLKAANSVWGTMSESTYTLVAGRGQTNFLISAALGRQHFFSVVFLAQMMVPAGLSLCLQFVADLTFFPVAWARFTQSSVALAASCMIFSYAVSYKQVIRAEQCFSTAYSLFEPRNFQGWHEWELFSRRYHEIEEWHIDAKPWN